MNDTAQPASLSANVELGPVQGEFTISKTHVDMLTDNVSDDRRIQTLARMLDEQGQRMNLSDDEVVAILVIEQMRRGKDDAE